MIINMRQNGRGVVSNLDAVEPGSNFANGFVFMMTPAFNSTPPRKWSLLQLTKALNIIFFQ